MKTKCLTLLALLGATLLCHAGKAPEHTCRILFLDRPAGAPRTLHLFDGVSSQEVELPEMNLSPVYKLRSGALRLLLLPAPVDDPKTAPSDAPAVLVPEDLADFYLLITSDRQNTVSPVRMNIINANDNQLAPGRMLWFNLSDKAVAGTLGNEKIAIRPGDRELVKEPRSDQGDYPVDLYFMIKGDDFVHPLCATKWNHDPRSRSMVFIMSEGNLRAPRVFSITDFRQSESSTQEN